MSKNREEWIISASKKKVWDLLSRVNEWPQWMPGVRDIEKSDREHYIALRNENYGSSTAGFPLHQEITVNDVIPEQKLVVTRRIPGMNTTSTYELTEDSPGKTKIVRTIETRGILGHIAGAMSSSEKSNLDVKLERLLEAAEEPLSA